MQYENKLKQQLEQYTLTKPEITALKELSVKHQLSISQIADAINKSNSLASLLVKSLKGKGFVETEQKGSSKKLVSIAQTSHAQYFADLVENEPNVPWEDILSYSNAKVLLNYLSNTDIGNNISETTKWRALRNLSAHGMLATPEQAALNNRVKLFIDAFADYVSRQLASEILPKGAVIIWRKGGSYLFKVKSTVSIGHQFHKTALTMFPRYGIKFVTDEEYYFVDSSGKNLSVEDYVLHTLLLDPSSGTYVGYALLLMFKKIKSMDMKALDEKAADYGISGLFDRMLHYVDTMGKESASPFPKWEELTQLANLYGIKLP